MDPPCKPDGKDCPNRCISPNCHSTCESYKKFREWKDWYNSLISEENHKEAFYLGRKKRDVRRKRPER